MELFRLLGTIALQGTEEAKAGISGVSDHAQKSSGKMGKAFGAVGKAIGTVGKVATAAVAAGTAAAGALTKAAVDSYANYEQLVGGVETLFKDSGDKVLEYANRAYETAGMSANAYMETVTSFSASLLQSLGGDTAAAADKADRAITDMADNANKMGTAMESIQNAYQGFAKQNYTMLDNLKLGYGGTKEEMARLLEDATKLSGVEYDLSSYADIVDAIHVIQEEMGIAGTTAKEASETISGSAAAMKAAWDNVLTGLADPEQDVGALVGKLGDSVLTFADNIIPRIEATLNGIGALIEQVVPPIIEKLPELIVNVLPKLISAGASIVTALAQAIITAFPQLLQLGSDLIGQLMQGLSQNIGSIMTTGIEIISTLLSSLSEAIITNLPLLMQIGVDLLMNLIEGLTQNIDSIVSTAAEIVVTLVDGISSALPELIPAAIEAIVTLVEALTNPDTLTSLIECALALIQALADGLLEALPTLVEAIPEIIINLTTAIIENLPTVLETGIEVLLALIDGILNALPEIYAAIPDVLQAISDTFMEYDWLAIGGDLLVKIGEGILNAVADLVVLFGEVMAAIQEAVENGVNTLLDIFDFEWELPHIKMPHFKISGEFSLNPPSVPDFDISWYAKGGVLTQPTIFGMSGNTLLGGGEAGDEAVAPIDVLQGYVAEAVASQNAGLVAVLKEILFAIMSMDSNMTSNMKKALESMVFELNNREFARLVKAVN